MDDAPDAPLAILFKHSPHLSGIRQVALNGIDLGAFLIRFRRVLGQRFSCELRDTFQRAGVRIMVVIDRDDFVPSRLLQGGDDMGA